MGKPNFKLKVVLLELFGHQYDAARSLGIRESRLSLIIHGHVLPTAAERRVLGKVIGKDRIAEILEEL